MKSQFTPRDVANNKTLKLNTAFDAITLINFQEKHVVVLFDPELKQHLAAQTGKIYPMHN